MDWVDVPEGVQTHSQLIFSHAIANHATRAKIEDTTQLVGAAAILVPGKKGMIYTLHGVEITVKSVLTTVVNNGGLFEFENDSIDWKPFELYPNVTTAVGANAGAPMSPAFIPCHKPLPAGSNVWVYYTAQNAAIDYAIVTLVYSTQLWDNGVQTFSKAGIGTAITQITKATSHVTITIPAGKGGKLLGFFTQVYGTIETIVVSGGFVQVHNQSTDPTIEPCEYSTGGVTSIGTGGAELKLTRIEAEGDVPGNSVFTFDFTPTDNQSQLLAIMVIWEA
jgi:hypothetical protein